MPSARCTQTAASKDGAPLGTASVSRLPTETADAPRNVARRDDALPVGLVVSPSVRQLAKQTAKRRVAVQKRENAFPTARGASSDPTRTAPSRRAAPSTAGALPSTGNARRCRAAVRANTRQPVTRRDCVPPKGSDASRAATGTASARSHVRNTAAVEPLAACALRADDRHPLAEPQRAALRG